MSMDPQVLPIEDVTEQEITAAIADAFGSHFSYDWYRWKHREGPWGPSRGLVATDEHGILGVRLLLPWGLRFGKVSLIAHRAVEAATVPRAQGKGVFKRLNNELMTAMEEEELLFSTPNELSRQGYAKLGWRLLPPISHSYRLVGGLGRLGAGARLIDASLSEVRHAGADHGFRIGTDWSVGALQWRTDPRCGREYKFVRLGHAETPNGLLYRVTKRRGVRVLVVVYGWGGARPIRALMGGAANRERAIAALRPDGSGAMQLGEEGKVAFRHGSSLLALWRPPRAKETDEWPVFDVSRWSLSLADLESVL